MASNKNVYDTIRDISVAVYSKSSPMSQGTTPGQDTIAPTKENLAYTISEMAINNSTNRSTNLSNEGFDDGNFDQAFREAQIAIIVFYTLIIVVAVIGNSCVVYLVVSQRKMRNVTNYFIASLAVSDLCMAILCIPFSFVANVLLDYWPFGEIPCPILLYLQIAIVFVNAYTLLAMSLERFIAINHPFLRRLGKKRCLQIVGLCWALAFLTPIPTAVTSKIHRYERSNGSFYYICYEDWGSEQQSYSYSVTIMVLQYFVPLAVLIYTYARIVHVIWLKDNMPTPAVLMNQETTEMKREVVQDPRKKIIKMMLTVVGIYGVCWLPTHVLQIISDLHPSVYLFPYFRVVWIASNWLAMSSCAYNPFIYWWMNPKFREGYIHLCRQITSTFCRICCRKESDDFGSSNYSRKNIFKSNGVSTGTISTACKNYSATHALEMTPVNKIEKSMQPDIVPNLQKYHQEPLIEPDYSTEVTTIPDLPEHGNGYCESTKVLLENGNSSQNVQNNDHSLDALRDVAM